MKRRLFVAATVALMAVPSMAQKGDGVIKNDPSFAVRAKELVSKMTLEEKVSQTTEESDPIDRLGVPAYNWWNEILHGVARSGDVVTVYPQAIGMAANFDREALKKMGDQASDEARAIYNHEVEQGNFGKQYKGLTFWTPNINIFRDPRWGRGQETYGEDPYLSGELGLAIVEGLEGTDEKYLKVSACAKHYAVHSGPEHSRHTYDANPSMYDLWNTYLPAFEKLVVDGQVTSVMCAYNRFEGEPCCGSENLMINILRNRWGFKGYVTSDCGAINNFWLTHKTEPNARAAAAKSIQSGTDLECGAEWSELWTYDSLALAVEEGLLDEAQLDESLCRLFEIRMRLGMFDDKDAVPYNKIPYEVVNCPEHAAHALLMAQQSMVLLKNNGVLPLAKGEVKNIAVVGPNANNEISLLGNYNGFPEDAVTVYEGMKAKFAAANVVNTAATDFTVALENEEEELAKIADCDIVVFVGGIHSMLEGEDGCVDNVVYEGFDRGDRTTIALPRVQTEFMKKVKAAGKKLIVVNMSGSAMAMNWENDNADAIIQAWYGGQAAGTAVADIIAGDYNPSGRLPLTFYASDSDLGDINSYSMKNRTYRYFIGEPLWEFGYGLSFTKYEYGKMKVKESKEGYEVSVKVKNVGKMAGDEVVQLYVAPDFTSELLPLKSLRDFTRISLKAGQTKTVKFTLPKSAFSINDDNGTPFYIEGNYSICVGGRQPSKEAIAAKSVATKSVAIK